MTMTIYKLKREHPAAVAFENLCKKAEELGILMVAHGGINEVCYDGRVYQLKDLEDGGHCATEFPPLMDYKLTFEDEN